MAEIRKSTKLTADLARVVAQSVEVSGMQGPDALRLFADHIEELDRVLAPIREV